MSFLNAGKNNMATQSRIFLTDRYPAYDRKIIVPISLMKLVGATKPAQE